MGELLGGKPCKLYMNWPYISSPVLSACCKPGGLFKSLAYLTETSSPPRLWGENWTSLEPSDYRESNSLN